MMRTPNAAPTPAPALAPLLTPPEDDEEACDVLVTVLPVEEGGKAVVVMAGLVDVGTAEADVALVIVIDRELEADDRMDKPALA